MMWTGDPRADAITALNLLAAREETLYVYAEQAAQMSDRKYRECFEDAMAVAAAWRHGA